MANTTKTPLEVVKAFSVAMEQKDFDNGLMYVADNCEYTNGPMGTFKGPAGVRAVLEPFFAPVVEQTFIIRREVASGPVVVLERLDRHLMPTGWIELPVTGVYEVHDGRITVWHEYFDLATIMNQMPAAAG